MVWKGRIVSSVLWSLKNGGVDGGNLVWVTGTTVGGTPDDDIKTLGAFVDETSTKLFILKFLSKAGNIVVLPREPSKLLFGVKNSN